MTPPVCTATLRRLVGWLVPAALTTAVLAGCSAGGRATRSATHPPSASHSTAGVAINASDEAADHRRTCEALPAAEIVKAAGLPAHTRLSVPFTHGYAACDLIGHHAGADEAVYVDIQPQGRGLDVELSTLADRFVLGSCHTIAGFPVPAMECPDSAAVLLQNNGQIYVISGTSSLTLAQLRAVADVLVAGA